MDKQSQCSLNWEATLEKLEKKSFSKTSTFLSEQ
jgi:hypothetical protein